MATACWFRSYSRSVEGVGDDGERQETSPLGEQLLCGPATTTIA